YGLEFAFTLAHKFENTFLEAAYWSKGDYAIHKITGETDYAIRGKSRSRRTDAKPHPTFFLFDSILNGSDTFPPDLHYCMGGILQVGMYNQIQASVNGYVGLNHLRPGDKLPDSEHTAHFNNHHFPTPDQETFLRRRNRKKAHRGKPVRWFEKYAPKGIKHVH